jgi:hypothetical protein
MPSNQTISAQNAAVVREAAENGAEEWLAAGKLRDTCLHFAEIVKWRNVMGFRSGRNSHLN